MTTNAIRRFLEREGIPWQESLATLAARYGVRSGPYPYHRESVFLDAPLRALPPMTHPLSFQLKETFDLALPPVSFAGQFGLRFRRPWLASPLSSIQVAFRILVETLAVEIGVPAATDNETRAAWQVGAASIAIERPDRRDGSIPNPESGLCSIVIQTGYRPPCSVHERELVEACRPEIALSPPAGQAWVSTTPAMQYELEFVREPCEGAERTLGHICVSQDGGTVLFTTRQFYLVPKDCIRAVRIVEGDTKFGIWSEVDIMCASGATTKALPIRTVERPGGLEDYGQRLAHWLDVPVAHVR